MKRIWHFSDTHGYHEQLKIPDGIDIAIFSGDCSNPRDPYRSEPEVREFLHWYSNVDIKHKIFVAGNHDAAIAEGLISEKKYQDFSKRGIIYLDGDTADIEGIKIWGSPYCPEFGGWHFMRPRAKMNKLWQTIPEDTDILVTHTPPKGILDLAEDRDYNLEQCGCGALYKRVQTLDLKLHCFGHIHNNDIQYNAGKFISGTGMVYSNGSVVTDNRFGKITSNGNIIEV